MQFARETASLFFLRRDDSFSQFQETLASNLRFLEQSGISAKGMETFLEKLGLLENAPPEQVRAMVQDLAESYEDPAEVVRWYYSQPQQLGQAEALVVEDNVVAWVLQNARTVDKEISFDELMGTAA